MDLCDEGTANDRHGFEHQFSTNLGVTTAISFFAKDVDRRYVHLQQMNALNARAFIYADLQTGTITDSGVTGGSIVLNSSGIESFTNSTYRIWMVVTSAADALEFLGIYLSDRADDSTGSFSNTAPSYTGTNKKIYIWGVQFEDGSFPSSYIPTTTTAVTRATDSITLIGNLDTIIQSTAGSCVLDIITISGGHMAAGAQIIRGSFPSMLLSIPGGGGSENEATDTNNSTTDLTNYTFPAGGWQAGVKIGVAGNASGRSLVNGGLTVTSDAAAWVYLQQQFTGVNVYNYYRRLTFWNSKLADATLQGFTAP
jgi:hypothetical protein